MMEEKDRNGDSGGNECWWTKMMGKDGDDNSGERG